MRLWSRLLESSCAAAPPSYLLQAYLLSSCFSANCSENLPILPNLAIDETLPMLHNIYCSNMLAIGERIVMLHTITAVHKGSIADQLGVVPGDALVSINGRAIIDWIDYEAFSCTENLSLVIRRGDEEIEYELEKDEYEPLGLQFETQLMSPVRNCANKCIFCFVDQLPEHVRPTLRVKDDDWRLSLMMGNFVTLTNVNDKELNRIIERHASPLYISVHTVDGALRAKMLGTPLASKIMSQLNKLKNAGLAFHAQAVLCPGINDGELLQKTVEQLAALHPYCLSLALVPVGLTEHRAGLTELRKFTKAEARAVIDQVAVWQRKYLKKFGSSFVSASDEFYLAAGVNVPADEVYEGYPQIENGVGLMRLLETEMEYAYESADLASARSAHLVVATGTSVAPFMKSLMRRFEIPGVTVDVIAIENHFFGSTVTVSGLLTGSDLIRALSGIRADKILITECMLREGEDIFLDDMPLSDVERIVGVPFVKVGRHGESLLNALMYD